MRRRIMWAIWRCRWSWMWQVSCRANASACVCHIVGFAYFRIPVLFLEYGEACRLPTSSCIRICSARIEGSTCRSNGCDIYSISSCRSMAFRFCPAALPSRGARSSSSEKVLLGSSCVRWPPVGESASHASLVVTAVFESGYSMPEDADTSKCEGLPG